MQIKYLCAPRYHHTHWISGLLCMRTCTETISKHFYIQKTEREERRDRRRGTKRQGDRDTHSLHILFSAFHLLFRSRRDRRLFFGFRFLL